jgi:hypothetical protein
MMIIPAAGKINHTQVKAYCPISLLFSMQKMMQKFETRNVKDEKRGMSPTSTKISLQIRSKHKPKCTM